jgi:hypothetical protein
VLVLGGVGPGSKLRVPLEDIVWWVRWEVLLVRGGCVLLLYSFQIWYAVGIVNRKRSVAHFLTEVICVEWLSVSIGSGKSIAHARLSLSWSAARACWMVCRSVVDVISSCMSATHCWRNLSTS